MSTEISRTTHLFQVYETAARTESPEPNTCLFMGTERPTGLVLFINPSIIGVAPSVTFAIDGVDPYSGGTYNILTSAAVTTAANVILRVHPDLTAEANEIAKDALPPVFRITATHGNSDTITYSVTGMLTG